MRWENYVSSKLGTFHGKSCIMVTRVIETVILDRLAVGMKIEESVEHYPNALREVAQTTPFYAVELADLQKV